MSAVINPGNERIRILRADTCLSLSGRTSIDFQVGCDASEGVLIRIVRTSGNGFFSKEWVKQDSIEPFLHGTVTASTLLPIFKGKSVNTAGFLMAVLKHLGLIQAVPEALRGYQVLDTTAFFEHTKQLIADGVDLEDVPPDASKKKSMTGRKGIRKKAEKTD